MMTWQDIYVHRYYTSRPGFVNGTQEFWSLCASSAPGSARVLEVGAGPSNETSSFLSQFGDVHGVDVDPAVVHNSYLMSANVISPSAAYPFPDEYFDLCVSDYVAEHISNPGHH